MKKLISSSFRPLALAGAACFLLLGSTAAPARAADSGFTPTQRAEIVEIMRNALKTDPSILSDAITALQAKASAQKATSALEAVHKNPAQFGDSTTDVVLGNPHGKLKVVEFYDPRCPYCRKVLADLDKLVAAEPDLKLVEKVIPVLGPNSVMDTQAILAAGLQNAYVPFQKALMADPASASTDRIRRIALHVGLDPDRLLSDMKNPKVIAAASHNLELARSIDLEGTPTFIIGDKEIIPGAVSYDELRAALGRLREAG
ncbi:DsbA family protein [Acetobacter senegalensis]|uniref:DsbA family protein n=1 Tax=Acetobacter senegalensis TaxID=446692 RepID=UPI001EDA8930|nr:DsbA family protein [Acetobacter senegalensis]MCG4260072.1 DsbA family protein [Acetobacter senegalensis]